MLDVSDTGQDFHAALPRATTGWQSFGTAIARVVAMLMRRNADLCRPFSRFLVFAGATPSHGGLCENISQFSFRSLHQSWSRAAFREGISGVAWYRINDRSAGVHRTPGNQPPRGVDNPILPKPSRASRPLPAEGATFLPLKPLWGRSNRGIQGRRKTRGYGCGKSEFSFDCASYKALPKHVPIDLVVSHSLRHKHIVWTLRNRYEQLGDYKRYNTMIMAL
jgi:hypothetical protein